MGGWRCGLAVPLVVGGWIISWGGLQAYLLSNPMGGLRWRILRPAVVNFLFVPRCSHFSRCVWPGLPIDLPLQRMAEAFSQASVILESITYSNTFDLYDLVVHELSQAAVASGPVELSELVPALVDLNEHFLKVQRYVGNLLG